VCSTRIYRGQGLRPVTWGCVCLLLCACTAVTREGGKRWWLYNSKREVDKPIFFSIFMHNTLDRWYAMHVHAHITYNVYNNNIIGSSITCLYTYYNVYVIVATTTATTILLSWAYFVIEHAPSPLVPYFCRKVRSVSTGEIKF